MIIENIKIYQLIFLSLFVSFSCNTYNNIDKVCAQIEMNPIDSINILEVKLINNSKNDYYLTNFFRSIKFYDTLGNDITNSILYITTRSRPLYYVSAYARENCYEEYPQQFIIGNSYDSLLKYIDTDVGHILYEACNVSYIDFLEVNDIETFKDSLFIKEFYLSEYSRSLFLKKKSRHTICFNFENILDSKTTINALIEYNPNLDTVYFYFKPDQNNYDSLKYSTVPLISIGSYLHFNNVLRSDTISIVR